MDDDFERREYSLGALILRAFLSLGVADVWRLIRRSFPLAMIAGAAVGTATFFVSEEFLPRSYSSTAVLVRKPDPERISINDSRSSYMPSVHSLHTLQNLLKLEATLEEAINRSGLDVQTYDLAQRIRSEVPKGTEVLNLSVTLSTPESAQLATSALVEATLSQNIAARQREAQTVVEVLQQELASALLGVSEIEFRQASVRTALNGLLPSVALDSLLRERERVRADRDRELINASRLRVQKEHLTQAMETSDREVILQVIERSSVASRVAEKTREVIQLRSRYQPENPKLQSAELELKELVASQDSNADMQTDGQVVGKDMLFDQARIELLRVEQTLAAHPNAIASLDTLLERIDSKVNEASNLAEAYLVLARDHRFGQELVSTLKNRLQEATFYQRANASDFVVVQQPAQGLEQQRPTKLLALGASGASTVLVLILLLASRCLFGRISTSARAQRLTGMQNLLEIESKNSPPSFLAVAMLRDLCREKSLVVNLATLAPDTWMEIIDYLRESMPTHDIILLGKRSIRHASAGKQLQELSLAELTSVLENQKRSHFIIVDSTPGAPEVSPNHTTLVQTLVIPLKLRVYRALSAISGLTFKPRILITS